MSEHTELLHSETYIKELTNLTEYYHNGIIKCNVPIAQIYDAASTDTKFTVNYTTCEEILLGDVISNLTLKIDKFHVFSCVAFFLGL